MPDHDPESGQQSNLAKADELYRRALSSLAGRMGELATGGGIDPSAVQLTRGLANRAMLLADSVDAVQQGLIEQGLAGLSDLAKDGDIVASLPSGSRAAVESNIHDANFFNDISLETVPAPPPDPKLPIIDVEMRGATILRIKRPLGDAVGR